MGKETKNQSLTEIAIEKLKHDIVTGFFLPQAHLNIGMLKARYEMGATPVREALNQLEVTGLVEAIRLKGFKVAAISCENLQDIIDTRRLVETNILEQAIASGDDQWESQIIASHHLLTKCENQSDFIEQSDIDTWMDRFKDFYNTVLSASESTCQLKIQQELFDQTIRYCYLFVRSTHQFNEYRQPQSEYIKKFMQAVIQYDTIESQLNLEAMLEQTKTTLLSHWGAIESSIME